MNKIYISREVAEERTAQIFVEIVEEGSRDLSYGTLCCEKRYRRATLVGCTLSVFVQLTGINVIMFYSNMVFKGLEIPPSTVTFLIGIVNFVASFIGVLLLACLGLKFLMLWFNAAMALTLILLSVFAFQHSTAGMVSCVLLFILFFNFSSGTIMWIYMSEIMQEKAVSIATFLNNFMNLVISVSIPFVVRRV
jgi:hypothetical protein